MATYEKNEKGKIVSIKLDDQENIFILVKNSDNTWSRILNVDDKNMADLIIQVESFILEMLFWHMMKKREE